MESAASSLTTNLGRRIVGKHVYGNLYECDPSLLEKEEELRDIVVKAAQMANMTLWDVRSWRFGGEKGGVSAIALVLESHVAIHTWKEYRYATVDVFTCGEKSDPERAFEYVVSRLGPLEYTKHYADRSSR